MASATSTECHCKPKFYVIIRERYLSDCESNFDSLAVFTNESACDAEFERLTVNFRKGLPCDGRITKICVEEGQTFVNDAIDEGSGRMGSSDLVMMRRG